MINDEFFKLLEYFDSAEYKLGKTINEELANKIKNVISKNPNKYCENLGLFTNKDRIYQSYIIYAFQIALKEKKIFNWANILDFCSEIIESQNFWSEYRNELIKNVTKYCDWIISNIAELIEYGTHIDYNPLPIDMLLKVKELLLTLNRNTEPITKKLEHLIMDVLNNSKGKIFSSLLNVSLYDSKYCRSNQREYVWDANIKNEFTKCLNTIPERSLECLATIGRYLILIYYNLDKDWIIRNINKIFALNNELEWKSTFLGYLGLNKNWDEEIYDLIECNGHYSKAIETDFSLEHINNYVVDHICFNYLIKWKEGNIENSLMVQLINNKNNKQLLEIIWFLKVQKEEEYFPKTDFFIKNLWKNIVYAIADKEEHFADVFVNLLEWLYIIDSINDETFILCKKSVSFLNHKYHTLLTIEESFLKHVDNNPSEIGLLFIEIINIVNSPPFSDNGLIKLVTTLYEKSEIYNNIKKTADTICNIYLERGFIFLRKIYDKYNSH